MAENASVIWSLNGKHFGKGFGVSSSHSKSKGFFLELPFCTSVQQSPTLWSLSCPQSQVHTLSLRVCQKAFWEMKEIADRIRSRWSRLRYSEKVNYSTSRQNRSRDAPNITDWWNVTVREDLWVDASFKVEGVSISGLDVTLQPQHSALISSQNP